MKHILLFVLVLGFTFGCAKDSISYCARNKSIPPLPEDPSSEELMLTELDDMTNLFPFKEKLNPQDPSFCIETIAKKQQEEFVREKDLIELKAEKKN